jgi:Uma2 family endonuclease
MTACEPINVPHAAKLRVQDFMVLNDAGAFSDYAKSELIEGEIWVMNAVWTAHAKTQFRLSRAIDVALASTNLALEVYTNLSIDVATDCLPEPDIVIAQDHDTGAMPLSKVALLIEISDSTLANDLGRKASLYATASAPEYWVVDLESHRIMQFWAPADGTYRQRRETAFGEMIEAATPVGVKVATDRLI